MPKTRIKRLNDPAASSRSILIVGAFGLLIPALVALTMFGVGACFVRVVGQLLGCSCG